MRSPLIVVTIILAVLSTLLAVALVAVLLSRPGGQPSTAPTSRPRPVEPREPSEPLESVVPPEPDDDGRQVTYDAYVDRELTRVRDFVTWLENGDLTYERADGSTGYKGFIGEWGYPSRAGTQCTGGGESVSYTEDDARRWNAMGQRYLDELAEHGIWATWWAAGFPADYNKVSHIDSPAGLIGTTPAGDMLARASTESASGVNLPGAEWALDYPTDTDFGFLADEGIRLVRLPFDWEHVLTQEGVDTLYGTVNTAASHGVSVVLDLHNYGQSDYWSARSTRMKTEAFVDVWTLLSDLFHNHDAVVGYGLMNEPNDQDTFFDNSHEGAEWWQGISQEAVTAIRNRGDEKRIFVSGWNWANIRGFEQWTPEPWIDDPAENTWYEAHHYFDGLEDYNTSGDSSYEHGYETYLGHAVESGFEAFTESTRNRVQAAGVNTAPVVYEGHISC